VRLRCAAFPQVVAAKRSAIISGINEVEEARREEAWLCAFEADEARYKVQPECQGVGVRACMRVCVCVCVCVCVLCVRACVYCASAVAGQGLGRESG
jgi:hypothetical protein